MLEAIFLLGTTRMLRGSKDSEGIKEGEDEARVACELLHLTTQIEINLTRGGRKVAKVNGMKLPRASDILGRLPVACISVEDFEIVKGEPSQRRLFLDLELSALYPAYLRSFAGYKRTLEHRNSLLKRLQDGFGSIDELEPWTHQLAVCGAAMRQKRASYIKELNPLAERFHELLGEGEKVQLTYLPKEELFEAEELEAELTEKIPDDLRRGTTTVGPHRDDLIIFIGGKDARYFASQGQQRSGMISLKFSAMKRAEMELGLTPLLLLDDILSDLDAGRRGRLVDLVLGEAKQAILTCTEASAAGQRILESARLFTVSNGSINSK